MTIHAKFRGKRLDNGQWSHGGSAVFYQDRAWIAYGAPTSNDGSIIHIVRYEVDPKTIGRLIGIEDSRGHDIHEGDVVVFNVRDLGCENCKTDPIYGERGEVTSTPLRLLFGGWAAEYCYAITVIGNKHDNPEMLNNIIKINGL